MTITTAPDADAGTKDRIEIKVGDKGHFVELNNDLHGRGDGGYEKDL